MRVPRAGSHDFEHLRVCPSGPASGPPGPRQLCHLWQVDYDELGLVDRTRELLEELVRLRKSGDSTTVEVKHDDRTTTLGVVDGQVVSARSAEAAEPIGRILLRKRLLTQERYLEVLERIAEAHAINKNVRLGEVAVELGFVTEDDVRICLAEQLRSVLARIFSSEKPSWSKRTLEADRDASRDMAMSAEAAFLDAVRWLDDSRKDALGLRLARPLALAPVWPLEEIDEVFDLTPDEAEFARLAMAGDKTVEKLLDGKAPDGVDTYAVITALVAAGAAETRAPGAALRHKSPMRRGPPSLPAWAKVDATRARDVLEQMKMGSVAELKPTATPAGDPSVLADQAFFRGKDLLRKGRVKEAADAFEEARDLERNSPEYQLFFRWTKHAVTGGKMSAALRGELERAARAALRQNPKTALAHFVLGEIMREAGDAEGARRLLRQALRIEPDLFEGVRQERLRAMRRVRPNAPETIDDEPPSGATILAAGPTSESNVAEASEAPRGGTERPPVAAGRTDKWEKVEIPPAPKNDPSVRKAASRTRSILLAVLLLILAGGAVFVVFGNRILSPAPPPPLPPLPMPPRTATAPKPAFEGGALAVEAGVASEGGADGKIDEAGAQEVSADAGVLVFPKSAAGRRVFIDGKTINVEGERVTVPCGRHTVKVGSKGRDQSLDIPCGRETNVVP